MFRFCMLQNAIAKIKFYLPHSARDRILPVADNDAHFIFFALVVGILSALAGKALAAIAFGSMARQAVMSDVFARV